MCVFSSQSFWTSSSLDVPAGVTHEEGRKGFLIRLLSAYVRCKYLINNFTKFVNACNVMH